MCRVESCSFLDWRKSEITIFQSSPCMSFDDRSVLYPVLHYCGACNYTDPLTESRLLVFSFWTYDLNPLIISCNAILAELCLPADILKVLYLQPGMRGVEYQPRIAPPSNACNIPPSPAICCMLAPLRPLPNLYQIFEWSGPIDDYTGEFSQDHQPS